MEKTFSISDERVGNLIGKDGATKKRIEKLCGVKISVDDGVVSVRGESLDIMKAGNMIRAIDIGFPAEDAFLLSNPDLQLLVFDLEEVVSPSQMKRVVGRIIGEKGKSKRFFEDRLGLKIIVRDGKVAAIGDPLKIEVLREALNRLISGATHTGVYKFVERKLLQFENL